MSFLNLVYEMDLYNTFQIQGLHLVIAYVDNLRSTFISWIHFMHVLDRSRKFSSVYWFRTKRQLACVLCDACVQKINASGGKTHKGKYTLLHRTD